MQSRECRHHHHVMTVAVARTVVTTAGTLFSSGVRHSRIILTTIMGVAGLLLLHRMGIQRRHGMSLGKREPSQQQGEEQQNHE